MFISSHLAEITRAVSVYLTEIDEEGVIAGDADAEQEMGDESIEVFCTVVLSVVYCQ